LLDAAISSSSEMLTVELPVVSARYKAGQKCHVRL
jgi:hypothetical protein